MNEEQLTLNNLAIEIANKSVDIARLKAQLDVANAKIAEFEKEQQPAEQE
jgi:tRNA1(Val) A37 N6-methylase TrmN6